MSDILIQLFNPIDAEAVTRLWRESMQAAIGIPPVHSFDSHQYFLSHILPTDHEIRVAFINEEPVGFIAFNAKFVSQLYIKIGYQGKGIGKQLLHLAKDSAIDGLQLRTFEVNEGAQRFYERHGFVCIGGDDQNEEGLMDRLYEWKKQNSSLCL